MISSINGKTKLVGLVGYPVSHSLSPLIHNTLFNEHQLNFVYLPFPVKDGQLSKAILGLKAIGVKGFNVTVPYKEEIIPFLDNVDKNARFVGAVNTIVVEGEKLFGYNTDVMGFSASLYEAKIAVKGKKIAVLGAGGAARAIITSLAVDGANEVYIINRTYLKAKKLAEEFEKKLEIAIESYLLDDESSYTKVAQSDIIINTTSVGMEGKNNKSLLSEEVLFPHQTVIDIVYNPPETLLLKKAAKIGCNTLNGLGMLIHQALQSFKIWTGIQPSGEKIYSLLQEQKL
jgi:shikimate dehydrogenase